MHPHLYELGHVNAVIEENHRAARRAEQARHAQAGRPNRVAVAMGHLRAAVTVLVAGAREAAEPALVPCPELEPTRG